MKWTDFRKQLFTMMEERRSKAALFRLEQIYFFVTRARQCFESSEGEAQRAMGEIMEEGTFLLVADSARAFVALFPDPAASGEGEVMSAPPTSKRPSVVPPSVALRLANQPLPPPPARTRSGYPFQNGEV